ncbi:MAG: TonB-dependent receptor, partial [Ignavibacteriales bacterium]|nr:TonB-dependent receptor [Ignavibacteriales bacterium]
SGKVFDAKTHKPLEYCNIVIHKSKDSSLVTGTVTDVSGDFSIDITTPGRYYALLSFIGYDTKKIDSILITPKNLHAQLGEVLLADHYQRLKEVVVTGEKQEVINNLDKKVINVDKSLAASNGSAMDVIQNVPSVSVDLNGNVSMRGSANVTILINGKPSGLVGLSGTDILNQIPASSIESVEVITNPSVKYDPEGTSGILNIVLKKKEDIGFNGMLSVNAGTEDKYNSSVNLNYKMGATNFFTTYDNRINRMENESTSDRIMTAGTGESFLNQNGSSVFKFNSNNFNLGFDYAISPLTSLSASAQVRRFSMNINTGLLNTGSSSSMGTRIYSRNSDMSRNMRSNEYTLGYKQNFTEKGRSFTADITFADNAMDGDQHIKQVTTLPVFYVSNPQISVSRNTHQQFMFQSAYVLPVNELFKLETGAKVTIKEIDSKNDYKNFDGISGQWITDPTQQNYMDFNEKIFAGYGMATGRLWGFGYQTGLRYELVLTTIGQSFISNDFHNDYNSLYPSLHISREIFDGQEILVSVSRRVDRPNNRQLNPFRMLADSQNVSYGNPKLKPQYTNSYELGYSISAGPTSATSTVFYRSTKDVISNVSMADPARPDITISTFENIDKSNSYGVEVTLVQPLAQWWRFNANASYFNTEYISTIGTDNINKSNYSWMVKANSMMMLPLGIQFQLMFNYNSPIIQPQGRVERVFSTDGGLKKDFMDGDLSVNLRVTDIFKTQKFISETRGTGFILNSENIRNSRVAFLGVTYRIFNFDRSKVKDRKPGGDEMDF